MLVLRGVNTCLVSVTDMLANYVPCWGGNDLPRRLNPSVFEIALALAELVLRMCM
jgi:hypothetical protein